MPWRRINSSEADDDFRQSPGLTKLTTFSPRTWTVGTTNDGTPTSFQHKTRVKRGLLIHGYQRRESESLGDCLRQVGQRDTSPPRWDGIHTLALDWGSTPSIRSRLWMKGGNDSFFLIKIVEGAIQSFIKSNFNGILRNGHDKKGKKYGLLLCKEKMFKSSEMKLTVLKLSTLKILNGMKIMKRKFYELWNRTKA